MANRTKLILIFIVPFFIFASCEKEDPPRGVPPGSNPPDPDPPGEFYQGADLSYVNQILDMGGEFKVNDVATDPYQIFSDEGFSIARFRLWHDPQWTKDIYGAQGTQLYNDINDVALAISRAQSQRMQVLLDFHYADNWADPGNQPLPEAWIDITDINVLSDSVYNYTLDVLNFLQEQGNAPEFVQIGNEINCGMLFSDAPVDFPPCNACDGNWNNLRTILNSGIRAIRDFDQEHNRSTQIILHVADPVNVEWWFDNVMEGQVVNDFEIIGFSYYPVWHTGVALDQLESRIAAFRSRYNKEIMIMETAYPWTADGNDNYNNIFGGGSALNGYPLSPEGQLNMMNTITNAVKDGGGIGIIYWEPAWISSSMKDQWGTGSAWENNAFFDYNGNLTGITAYAK